MFKVPKKQEKGFAEDTKTYNKCTKQADEQFEEFR